MTDPIVKSFITDFGAVGDGTTDNMPAVNRWLAWAQAQGNVPLELYMPPGKYHFAGYAYLTDGLYNVTISGYGAIVDSLVIGSSIPRFDFNHSARIQTVSASATSINLLTSADASKFYAGEWILVSGLELQGWGYPPNFQFFEYKQITNISGSVVTLDSPLANSYESTWPLVPNYDAVFDQGGPATIYALGPTFDAQQTILGLEVTADQNDGAVFMNGRSLVLDGMKFDGLGPAPSFAQSIVIRNSYIGHTNEIDKVVSYVEYDNDTGHALLVQSAAPETLVIKHSTFDLVVGTAQNTSIEDSTIGLLMVGPLFFGAGESLSIVNSSISTAQEADQAIDPSVLAFRNGTFRIATASSDAHEVYSWAVPGHVYAFAYYDGAIHRQDDTGHVTTFKVLDVLQHAKFTYIETDLGATLPTPTFLAGHAANQYVAYPVMTAAETNSGPADVVSFAAPPHADPPHVPGSLSLLFPASHDFNSDWTSDILWQNNDGTPAVWLMKGLNPINGAVLPNPGPAWHAIDAADFNGDGKSDILLQNDSGLPSIWTMDGANLINGAALPNPGSDWHVKAAADFNGDGESDILLQNDSGLPSIWTMDGANHINGAALPDVGPTWHVAAAADFNGDGKSDILLQNDSGLPSIWTMDGANLINGAALPNPGSDWHVKAAADFNGDGKSDILLQNDSGLPSIWTMDGANHINGAALPDVGPTWHVAAAADFSGDGKADILWQHDSGLPVIWTMDGSTITAGAILPNPGSDWHLL